MKKLHDGRWYLSVMPPVGIHFQLSHYRNECTFRVVSNPSKLGAWSAYEDELRQILTEDEWRRAEVTRLDCTVDFNESFSSIKTGLQVKHKRTVINTSMVEDEQNAIRFGKSGGVILVYNKSLQAKLDHDVTRIEAQLRGGRLPCKKLSELQMALKCETFSPFRSILIHSIEFMSLDQLQSKRDLVRCVMLTTKMKDWGYSRAKKMLNQNDNFNRSYGRFFSIKETRCVQAAYEKSLKSFMGQATLVGGATTEVGVVACTEKSGADLGANIVEAKPRSA